MQHYSMWRIVLREQNNYWKWTMYIWQCCSSFFLIKNTFKNNFFFKIVLNGAPLIWEHNLGNQESLICDPLQRPILREF